MITPGSKESVVFGRLSDSTEIMDPAIGVVVAGIMGVIGDLSVWFFASGDDAGDCPVHPQARIQKRRRIAIPTTGFMSDRKAPHSKKCVVSGNPCRQVLLYRDLPSFLPSRIYFLGFPQRRIPTAARRMETIPARRIAYPLEFTVFIYVLADMSIASTAEVLPPDPP